MAKKARSKNIKTFSNVDLEEIQEAEDNFNNSNASDNEFDFESLDAEKTNTPKLRSVRTFASNANSALSDAVRTQTYNPNEEQSDNDYANRYQTNDSDISRMERSVSDSTKRVKDLINDMKRNDLSKSRDEREQIARTLDDANVRQTTGDTTTPIDRSLYDTTSVTPVDRQGIVDAKTIAENASNSEKAIANKEYLDNAFDLPKKKKSLLDRLSNFKNKEVAKKKAKVAAVKKKGLLNSLVEKTTGAGSKTIMGLIIKWLFIAILIIFLFTIIIAVIFYFSNNYTRDPSNSLDSKRLDTRVARAIFALKEQDALNDLYKDYIGTSQGDIRHRYEKNLSRLVPSDAMEKLRAGEDPDEAYILQDSSNWFLLYLERLSYAYGGYLDWEPEYLEEGAALANTSDRNPAGESVERWRQIAEEVGNTYGIDPNVLLALVDIESSGDPHAENGSHKGLGQIGDGLLSSYFKQGDEFYNWPDDHRTPHDIGSCDWRDEEHQTIARLQFTYIARRLTHQMAAFLKNNKGVTLSNASAQDKKTAIAFAVTGYNQGEARQLALYKTYGDALYDGDGTNYANRFLKHVDTRLVGNYKMVGADQANYLKLFYKFYNAYSGNDITNAMTDVTKWYEAGDLDSSKNISYGPYPGPVTETTKLVKGSTEIDTVNELKEKYYVEMLQYIVDQYNRWMKLFTNFYLTQYPDKFITDSFGNLIPELYEKDIYGRDIETSVIKYQSFIHNIVDLVTSYNTYKKYPGANAHESFVLLKRDLEEEVNDESSKIVKDEIHEGLADLEDDLAINRYEMSFEVLRTVDSNNEMLKNPEAIETIERSLSYSVPIYEYVTVNNNRANKSFFDYEIYNENNYNSDYTLKINHNLMQKSIDKINNINISMKSLIQNKWSADRQASAEDRMENAFIYMYTNTDKPYKSSNHYSYVPDDLESYYFIVNGRIYDRMVEKVHADEIYTYGTQGGNEGTTTTWTSCGDPGVSFEYQGLDTQVLRDYYLANIKPSTYTALKYIEIFDYVSVEDGDRDIENKEPSITYEKCTVTDNLSGAEVGVGYRKVVSRQSLYIKEKVRNATVLTRALRNK